MKKKWGIIFFFPEFILIFKILCTEKTFFEKSKNSVLIYYHLIFSLNDEASIQLDASFERIRTETRRMEEDDANLFLSYFIFISKCDIFTVCHKRSLHSKISPRMPCWSLRYISILKLYFVTCQKL